MSKKVFLTIGVALLLFNVNAQKKNIGIRAGYLKSHMSYQGDKMGSSDNNYFMTIYKDSKLFPFLYFQSGLEYTRMGGSYNNQTRSVDYLGVPLALKAKVGPVYAFGGASFNVKLSENGTFPDTPFAGKNKWYDSNAFVGAGIEIIIFTFDIKYVRGLTDVNNGIKNNGYQMGLGLRF